MFNFKKSLFFKMIMMACIMFLLISFSDMVNAEQMKDLTVGVGYFLHGVMNEATPYYMMKTRLFEKIAKEYGYNLNVKWWQFPNAPQQFTAAIAGDIQIGSTATFPVLVQLSRSQPFHILNNVAGHMEFYLVVDKDSQIKSFEDLKNKKIGVVLGTTHQFVLETFLKYELGGSPKELGITLVNQPLPITCLPKGIDAWFAPVAWWLPAAKQGNMEAFVLTAKGVTGPAYDGPLGKGADIPLPHINQSPYVPEGYVALRNFAFSYGDFINKHPDVIVAWMRAYNEALKALGKMNTTEVTDLYPSEYWKLMPRELFEKQAIGQSLMYKYRDWTWITRGDVEICSLESKMMKNAGIIPEFLSIGDIYKKALSVSSKLMKKAYIDGGSHPSSDIFTDESKGDMRGLPAWEFTE